MTASEATGTVGAPARRSAAMRLAFAGALLLLGVLLVVAARTADLPAESRSGDRVELVELIRAEQTRVDALVTRVEQLSADVAGYEHAGRPGAEVVAALQAQVDALAPAAGMTAVQGPGVVATLDDSVSAPAPDQDINSYVIHEQDLQAVINAFWVGGAEAMAVNGQRVLATTAIRCVGNTLLLHGRVYSPPYVIAAIGDQAALGTALERDPMVQRFTTAVEAFDLGWSVEDAAALQLPAYEGSPSLQVARPVGRGIGG